MICCVRTELSEDVLAAGLKEAGAITRVEKVMKIELKGQQECCHYNRRFSSIQDIEGRDSNSFTEHQRAIHLRPVTTADPALLLRDILTVCTQHYPRLSCPLLIGPHFEL